MSKHLSLSERSVIESMLNKDFTFAQIAKKLGRTGSTISREVHKHRVFTGKFDNYTHNDCIYFFSCLKNTVCPKRPTHGCFTRCKLCSEADCTKLCDRYVSCNCELLNKPPYVCTGCPKQKTCQKEHAYYTATKLTRIICPSGRKPDRALEHPRDFFQKPVCQRCSFDLLPHQFRSQRDL